MGKSTCGMFLFLMWDDIDILKMGPLTENADNFPKRVNAEFTEIKSRGERLKCGFGNEVPVETLACGTGACASGGC